MKTQRHSLLSTLIAGVLVIAPAYLAILLVIKAVGSLVGLVKPIALLLPNWLPAEQLIALLLLLALCLFVGFAIRTTAGRAARDRIEKRLFARLPGYALLRSLTQRMAGRETEESWQPAMISMDDGMVPGFLIEELENSLSTVFIPSIPTPFAGAVYVLESHRVHPVDLPFQQAIKVISRWGNGAGEMVKAMRKPESAISTHQQSNH
ncbi:hypothetical protein NT239_07370 [Chitinibacter sp. SCUT-21]|uniref:hypothetical protein n=1 Tax=Chitinibacter sp. SCUT-21 TaxID=2970891 RepID=UPI0035A60898